MSLSFPNTASSRSLTYELIILQQPLHARMCGFGDKDRRPVDPPPILQLKVRQPGGGKIRFQLDTTLLVVHVDLFYPEGERALDHPSHPNTVEGRVSNSADRSFPDPEEDMASTFPDPATGHPIRNLLGTIMGSSYHLQGLDQEMGIYYIFSDLSIRTEGTYRLGFTMMNLEG